MAGLQRQQESGGPRRAGSQWKETRGVSVSPAPHIINMNLLFAPNSANKMILYYTYSGGGKDPSFCACVMLCYFSVFPLKLFLCIELSFIVFQVSAKLSCPRRSVRRGGKSWKPNGQSAKLLKVLLNWAHGSWIERGRKDLRI